MYYEKLIQMRLALLRDYRILQSKEDVKKETMNELAKRIILINNKLNSGLIHHHNRLNQAELKKYKKAFKHEFLMQCYHGYSLENIIDNIDFLIPNPGINPYNYVNSLIKEGYLKGDIKNINSVLTLTDKALRYIENEANISLKR